MNTTDHNKKIRDFGERLSTVKYRAMQNILKLQDKKRVLQAIARLIGENKSISAKELETDLKKFRSSRLIDNFISRRVLNVRREIVLFRVWRNLRGAKK